MMVCRAVLLVFLQGVVWWKVKGLYVYLNAVYEKTSYSFFNQSVLRVTPLGSPAKCSIECLKEGYCVSFAFRKTTSTCALVGLQSQYSEIPATAEVLVYDQVIGCEEGWVANPHRHTCLKLVTVLATALVARDRCAEMGAALAIFDNEAAYHWFKNMRAQHPVWKEVSFVMLGGSQNNATKVWTWDNGSTDQLTDNFAAGSPNDLHIEAYCLGHMGNGWAPGLDDIDCVYVHVPYICEKSAN